MMMTRETILTLALLGSIALAPMARSEETIIGRVDHVRDGDTIEVRGVAIRLNGIDAPEMNALNGPQSRAAMIDIVDGRRVECDLTGSKTYDRMVGTCYLADGPVVGADIGMMLIRQGYALDCARYSGGVYELMELPAAQLIQKRAAYCEVK
jgi:endonuclease YncB( thermonuclease family)